MATTPYTVRLSWNAIAAPTFHHYNVYCGRQANFAVEQASLVASPDVAGCWDWALKPGEKLHYRVTWVDRGGNESPPSADAPVQMPAIARDVQEFAAAPRIDFRVARGGTYVIWLRLKNAPQSGRYIDLKIDQGTAATWTCRVRRLGRRGVVHLRPVGPRRSPPARIASRSTTARNTRWKASCSATISPTGPVGT